MAPAAIAITARAVRGGESRPRVPKRGATIPALVTRATVEDPWAVFRIADRRKGKKIPTTARDLALAVMKATMLVEAITRPRTPPAAVINSMGPTIFNVSLVVS